MILQQLRSLKSSNHSYQEAQINEAIMMQKKKGLQIIQTSHQYKGFCIDVILYGALVGGINIKLLYAKIRTLISHSQYNTAGTFFFSLYHTHNCTQ